MPNLKPGSLQWEAATLDAMDRHVQATKQAVRAELDAITTSVEQAKASPLQIFIQNRIEDAGDELKRLDPSFVDRANEQVSLEELGLIAPKDVTGETPKRLSKEWHMLLEACWRLVALVRCVKLAASSLRGVNFEGRSGLEAVTLAEYHLQGLFTCLQTLSEHVRYIVKCTTKVYLCPPRDKVVEKQYKSHVDETGKKIRELRNTLVHPGRYRYPSSIHPWEHAVAMGWLNSFKPSPFDVQAMDDEAADLRAGRWDLLEKRADYQCDLLGQNLLALERECLSARPPA